MNACNSELYKLLSLEYNCATDDFEKDENILTVSELIEGRRVYERYKDFFSMGHYGQ